MVAVILILSWVFQNRLFRLATRSHASWSYVESRYGGIQPQKPQRNSSGVFVPVELWLSEATFTDSAITIEDVTAERTGSDLELVLTTCICPHSMPFSFDLEIPYRDGFQIPGDSKGRLHVFFRNPDGSRLLLGELDLDRDEFVPAPGTESPGSKKRPG